eukprot:gene6760-7857_t
MDSVYGVSSVLGSKIVATSKDYGGVAWDKTKDMTVVAAETSMVAGTIILDKTKDMAIVAADTTMVAGAIVVDKGIEFYQNHPDVCRVLLIGGTIHILAPYALYVAGYTAAGIVKGSVAAKLMSMGLNVPVLQAMGVVGVPLVETLKYTDDWALFIDIVRDCYEAYVLYNFFKLLTCFLGGEEAIYALLDRKTPIPARAPLCCFNVMPNRKFYIRCLRAMIQYILIKPAMAIIAATLYSFGKFVPIYPKDTINPPFFIEYCPPLKSDTMEPMTQDYNDNCIIQQNTINANLDVIVKSINDWIFHSASTLRGLNPVRFNIADFGCSHGRSSLHPLSLVIRQFRQQFPSIEVSVLHNDLPQNDFGQLHNEVYNNPKSYIKISDNIFSFSVGKSFYEQVFPSNSIHFAIAFNCFHWSSKLSQPFRGTIYHGHSTDEQMKQKWQKDTVADLITILGTRGKELTEGGQLVTNFLSDDNNGFEKCRIFYRTVKLIWEGLALDGLISQDEADHMVYPFRYYTLDDIHEAVNSKRVQEQGLHIRYIELRHTKCPYEIFVQSHGPKIFAEKLFRGFCAFTEPTWRSNISGTDQHREKVWSQYQSRFLDYFSANPTHGSIPNNYYITILEKSLAKTSDHQQGSASC